MVNFEDYSFALFYLQNYELLSESLDKRGEALEVQ